MTLKIGDMVIIPPDRPGPRVGKLKSIALNDENPVLSKCIVDREFSSIHGIKLGELKPYNEVKESA